MVIDRLRTGAEGLLLCRELRRQDYPITLLMVVEQETVEERVACLEAGADDYLLKPYRAESFLQRIRFYLSPSETAVEQLQFSNLTLDLASRRLFLSGRVIELTMKEFDLLKYLMGNAKEVVTREQILEHVWGYDFQGESNIIEVYIRYLRLKLEQNGQKRFIHTVRGVGYVLRDN
jgi:DNA-binding response OmpR family regulator